MREPETTTLVTELFTDVESFGGIMPDDLADLPPQDDPNEIDDPFDNRHVSATRKAQVKPPQPTKKPVVNNNDPKVWANNLKRITVADCLKPLPPLREVISGVITRGSLTIPVGESGIGKSWFQLDCGVTIANAEPEWIGHKVYPGGVLYLDFEMGDYESRRRVNMVLRGHGVTSDIPFTMISLPEINLHTDLKRSDGRIRALIDKYTPSIVFCDPFINLCAGADENSAGDMIKPLVALKRIADDTDTAIVVSHHPGKGSSGKGNSGKGGVYRGSSAIKGAVDSLISITCDDNHVTFKHEKKRQGEAVDFYAMKFFSAGMFNLAPASPSAKSGPTLSKSQQYVIDYLTKHGASLIEDIANHADVCSPETARRAVYSLAAMRKVKRVDSGNSTGKGNKATYDLETV